MVGMNQSQSKIWMVLILELNQDQVGEDEIGDHNSNVVLDHQVQKGLHSQLFFVQVFPNQDKKGACNYLKDDPQTRQNNDFNLHSDEDVTEESAENFLNSSICF